MSGKTARAATDSGTDLWGIVRDSAQGENLAVSDGSRYMVVSGDSMMLWNEDSEEERAYRRFLTAAVFSLVTGYEPSNLERLRDVERLGIEKMLDTMRNGDGSLDPLNAMLGVLFGRDDFEQLATTDREAWKFRAGFLNEMFSMPQTRDGEHPCDGDEYERIVEAAPKSRVPIDLGDLIRWDDVLLPALAYEIRTRRRIASLPGMTSSERDILDNVANALDDGCSEDDAYVVATMALIELGCASNVPGVPLSCSYNDVALRLRNLVKNQPDDVCERYGVENTR